TYISGRTDLKGRSLTNLRIAAGHIATFFGADRPMRTITPAEADAFAVHAKGTFAEATAARIISRARQFFRAAIRAKRLTENVFADVKTGSMTNKDRQFHVDRETIAKVIDSCPDSEWRLIVALSRFGGIRCPSETLALQWPDVNWQHHRFTVRSQK